MKSLARLAGILGLLTLVGTIGFRLIEGQTWYDSLYMRVIT